MGTRMKELQFRRRWVAVSLLFPLLLLGCLPSSGLERRIQLESTVMALQTDVAFELAELRESISTPVMPTNVPSPTSTPSIPTSTPTRVATSVPGGTVTADVLNLRSGPGLNYRVMAHLQKGDELEAKARTEAGGWMKVSIAEGLEGWVAVEYVDLNVPLSSIPLAVEIPSTPTLGPTASVTSTTSVIPTATVTTTATSVPSEE
ncbi:MAG: SH3 domain-containing protein [Chloroflexota bacterium]|nr:SH3 domain-containing protein [Chloroflexota bacterium]